MDQIAARVLGADTELASLELSLESREAVGACDPGYSCAYANTLSGAARRRRSDGERSARRVRRLFGGSDSTDLVAWPRGGSAKIAASSMP
jgi:hypothetical protein